VAGHEPELEHAYGTSASAVQHGYCTAPSDCSSLAQHDAMSRQSESLHLTCSAHRSGPSKPHLTERVDVEWKPSPHVLKRLFGSGLGHSTIGREPGDRYLCYVV
jgi:hypothetical protein